MNPIVRWMLLAGVLLGPASKGTALELNWQSDNEKRKVDRILDRVEKTIEAGAFKDDWDSLRGYPVPEWFRDGKFGIFIHWGLYSVPGFGNEWYSRNMYEKDSAEFKHHAATYGPQTKFGYKDFIPLFKAEKFRPDDWASLFKEAGAKYVVPVAEHHDGFMMYDSELSRWTAKKMGPKRDLLGDLSRAFGKKDLVFATSSHRAEHWWFMNGGRRSESDVTDPKYADFYGPADMDEAPPSEEYLRNWLARSCELVDKYQPRLFYFDWWIGERPGFEPYLKKFAAYYYNRSVEWDGEGSSDGSRPQAETQGRPRNAKGVVLITKDKAYVPGTTIMDVEKGGLPDIHPRPWQTDTTISWRSWAFLKEDSLKDTPLILRTLMDAVSKNANLLLDVGPGPDGTIPEGQAKVLREVGAWLKVNGEAVYGTRPWVKFGEGPTQTKAGKFSETEVKYTAQDLRFTRKGDSLYVMTLMPPEGPVTVKSLKTGKYPDLQVLKAWSLSDGKELAFQRTPMGLILPAVKGSAGVFKLQLGGSASSDPQLTRQGSSFTVNLEVQNYDGVEVDRQLRLVVGKTPVQTKVFKVPANSSVREELSFNAPRSGIFSYSVLVGKPGWKGKKVRGGRAALPAMDLSGEWLFRKGDGKGWEKPGLSEKEWEAVKLPASWESHSQYSQDNVFGWYRKKVVFPLDWTGRKLILPLGKIDDADEVYVNGVKVGSTGSFPPKFEGFWDKPRVYEVPAKHIRFGEENVIAVRVFDAWGGGGIYDGPMGPVDAK